jgi:hypothetical protein
MSDGESVGWIGVDFFVFSIFHVENTLSELVFFLGTVAETEFGNMLNESLLNFHLVFVVIFTVET